MSSSVQGPWALAAVVGAGGPPSKSPAGGDEELQTKLGGREGVSRAPALPSADGAIRRLDRFSAEDDAT